MYSGVMKLWWKYTIRALSHIIIALYKFRMINNGYIFGIPFVMKYLPAECWPRGSLSYIIISHVLVACDVNFISWSSDGKRSECNSAISFWVGVREARCQQFIVYYITKRRRGQLGRGSSLSTEFQAWHLGFLLECAEPIKTLRGFSWCCHNVK